ncbi:MAG: hypothetical protein EA361_01320 [Bacteroidetes bacterium]|nr:MAG: hypothetical protein EA361_01320 [Bacteroidota bacterium]
MFNLRKIAVFGLLLILFQQVLSQEVVTSSRIRVESGGSVPFNINSYKKYEEGMSFEYWTRLSLSFSDSIVTGTETNVSTATWKLEFKANTISMSGDYGGELDLDLISIKLFDAGGNNELGEFIEEGGDEGYVSLSDAFQTLIKNAPQGNFNDNKILITYRIGQGEKKLLNNPPDYFTVDIIFELSKWAD